METNDSEPTSALSLPDRVRKDAAYVADQSSYVKIDAEAIERLANRLTGMSLPQWDHDVHYSGDAATTVAYLLLLDALNFCFWPSRYLVERKGKTVGDDDGYFALAAALTNAFEAGVPLWDAEYLATVRQEDFRRVFLGKSGVLDLMDVRVAQAQDLGKTLLARYDGDPLGPVYRAQGDASAFANILGTEFACYRDVRPYGGREVALYKRAQLCAADVSSATGLLSGVEELTCFADYKLPQLFRSTGVFIYDDELDEEIAARFLLPEGCAQEVEIRCCTVHAVELLVDALKVRRMYGVSAKTVDYLLWTMSIDPRNVSVPHHRTFTSSY